MKKWISAIVTLTMTYTFFAYVFMAPQWAAMAVAWLSADITYAMYYIEDLFEDE